MDTEKLLRDFSAAYSYLYNTEDLSTALGGQAKTIYRTLVWCGEQLCEHYPEGVQELTCERDDYFTSDRELAALAIAVYGDMAISTDCGYALRA